MPFRDCIGHRRLIAVLAKAVHRGSLPPSLLLAGPEGVGKKRIAVALAQVLNCTQPQSSEALPVDACGACPACRRIARGVHPDVLLVEPGDSGTIKVDQVRAVIDQAGYRPFEGRRRIVIVDEADALVPQAQNALLKTLEEPPEASLFLLVTSRPDALLPTVRSRCPALRFRALSADDVAAALLAHGRTEVEARSIAAAADGSIGRALDASAEDLVESREVAARALRHAAAADDPGRRIEGAKDLLAGGGSGGAADRERLAVHLRAMAAIIRDVELVATGAGADAVANADVRGHLERLEAFGGERGLRAFASLDRALAALERNASPKVVADWVMLQL
jgi:DNA polymerase-3 subunit delta'